MSISDVVPNCCCIFATVSSSNSIVAGVPYSLFFNPSILSSTISVSFDANLFDTVKLASPNLIFAGVPLINFPAVNFVKNVVLIIGFPVSTIAPLFAGSNLM